MPNRTIGIYPSKRYNFRTNATYRTPWNFLPDDRAKVIGEQLTYLDFHEWLMDNLRHSDSTNPEADQWSRLVFNIAEGFFKTDVLLYASICEAALFSILHDVFNDDGDSAHDCVKECFQRVEDRFHKLNSCEISLTTPARRVKGELCLRFTQETAISDSEVKFASLIKAGEAIRIYDAGLRRRLDTLRDDRNAIHLAKQIQRNSQLRPFRESDRARAKQTTEELRVVLKAFVADHTCRPWP